MNISPKVIFIFEDAPIENGLASEAVDLVLVLSAFDADIEVYFVGEGLLNVQCKHIDKPRYTKRFKALGDFEVDQVFAVDSLERTFELPLKHVSQLELSRRVANCSRVLRF